MRSFRVISNLAIRPHPSSGDASVPHSSDGSPCSIHGSNLHVTSDKVEMIATRASWLNRESSSRAIVVANKAHLYTACKTEFLSVDWRMLGMLPVKISSSTCWRCWVSTLACGHARPAWNGLKESRAPNEGRRGSAYGEASPCIPPANEAQDNACCALGRKRDPRQCGRTAGAKSSRPLASCGRG